MGPLAIERPSLVGEHPFLVIGWSSLVIDRPSLAIEWPSLVDEYPFLVIGRPSLVIERPPFVDENPSLVIGWPFLVDWAGLPRDWVICPRD